MKKYLLSFILLTLPFLSSWAQQIQNVQAHAEKNKVIITYDLITSNQEQKFNVELRSSINNFTTALKEVEGEVGPDQSAGIGKTITWHALREQGNFSGSVSFEVTAEITYSPLLVTNPTKGSKAKIGKSLDVQWQGGDRGRNLKMAILQGTTTINEVQNVGSSGSYIWPVPKTLAKGDNYQVKLFDPTKPKDAAMSAQFQLKKTSVIVYIIPGVLAAGAAAYFLMSGDGGGEGPVDCTTNPTHPDCVTVIDDLATPPPPPSGGN
ncbi:MAG: Ser-Thr-rich GPI-anchored membrane family protein [Bacteroidota bacterium]